MSDEHAADAAASAAEPDPAAHVDDSESAQLQSPTAAAEGSQASGGEPPPPRTVPEDETAVYLGLVKVLWPIYATGAMQMMAQRFIIPVLPEFVHGQLGYSETVVGLVFAFPGLGKLCMNVPAGPLVRIYGTRNCMGVALLLMGVSRLLQGLATNVGLLLLWRFVDGLGDSLYGISRLTHVGATIHASKRGRAMSLLGGVARWGNVLGPLVGGLLSHHFSLRVCFVVQAILTSLAAPFVLCVPKVETHTPADADAPGARASSPRPSTCSLFKSALPVLANVGVYVFSLQGLRETRNLLFPIHGYHLDLSPASIGYVASFSYLVESVIFPAAGVVMDRWGRKAAGVPASLLMSGALYLLPATSSMAAITAVGLVAGCGNGLSSGLVMTMGSDLAPPDHRSEFLGFFRLFTDAAMLLAPVVGAALVDAVSMFWGSFMVGTMGVAGVAWLLLFFHDPTKPGAGPPAGTIEMEELGVDVDGSPASVAAMQKTSAASPAEVTV